MGHKGLFVTTESDEVNYTINHKLPDTEAVLDMYEFVGKVIGKAIFEHITLNAHFDHCVLRALTGRDVILEDLKTLDTQVAYPPFVIISMISSSSCTIHWYILKKRRWVDVIYSKSTLSSQTEEIKSLSSARMGLRCS